MFESYSRPGSGLMRFEAQGMGTVNVVLLGGAPEKALREAAQEAFETLARLEQALSKFLPSSDVSLLNLLGAGRGVAVGADLRRLLRLSKEAWELTGGAFDPTVGPILEAWGLVGGAAGARGGGRVPGGDLDRGAGPAHGGGRRPDPQEIASLLRLRGMDHVIAGETGGAVRFDRPGVSVDLGGIAKGYAVDRMVEQIRRRGVPLGAVISGRSSVAVWGSPPRGGLSEGDSAACGLSEAGLPADRPAGSSPGGEERWRFEVVHPSAPDETLRTLLVDPGAVSSSGALERHVSVGGVEYGHVIDPRSGEPARGVKAVTVWTPGALLGDVLSTAIYVLGRKALEPGGPVETLARRWEEPGEGEPSEEKPGGHALEQKEHPEHAPGAKQPSGVETGPERAGSAPAGAEGAAEQGAREARVSALLVLENPRAWGGIEVVTWHLGAPGFWVVEG